MSADESPKAPVWANIASMPSLTPRPGVRMYPAKGELMMINFVRLDPGAEVPLHQHENEQGGTVIEGSLLMTIDGETREMRAGDIYLAPPGSLHGAVAGPDGCLAVDVFAPPREDYVPDAD